MNNIELQKINNINEHNSYIYERTQNSTYQQTQPYSIIQINEFINTTNDINVLTKKQIKLYFYLSLLFFYVGIIFIVAMHNPLILHKYFIIFMAIEIILISLFLHHAVKIRDI